MEDKDLIIETTLLAGKIMIENGADMARIDDTLKRIAKNSGVTEPDIFETTTGIMMSIKGQMHRSLRSKSVGSILSGSLGSMISHGLIKLRPKL